MKSKTTKKKKFNVEDVEKVFKKLHDMLDGTDNDIQKLTPENMLEDGFFAILITKKGPLVSSQQIGKRIPAMVVGDTLLQILMTFSENVGEELKKDKKIGIA